jgi:hypothetical protein
MFFMQNIDPIFILQPVIVIAVSFALMMYWYFKRRFQLSVWLYTFIAYFGAIGLKYAVQIPTIAYVGANPYLLGAYFGLQTVIFEVGLAYFVAWYAITRRKLEAKDAEAYGSGLGFWENAVFLGALTLINLVTYYVILSTDTPLAQTLYDQLTTVAPALFAPAPEALAAVAVGTVERMSSLMIHVAWGYLCFMAVIYNKKRLFLVALPMGLVDFLVPFASESPILFEVTVLALAFISVFVAWFAVKWVKKTEKTDMNASSESIAPQQP